MASVVFPILFPATVVSIAGLLIAEAAGSQIVTGTSGGAPPHVKSFSGSTGAETGSFLAYGAGTTVEVRVAAGDVNGDGIPDIITGAGPGAGPHVKVFSGATHSELSSFFAYAPSFTGGVYVAAGDVTGDGHADIITGYGTIPHVKVFSGATGAEINSFFAYPTAFSGGVRVAAGDVIYFSPAGLERG